MKVPPTAADIIHQNLMTSSSEMHKWINRSFLLRLDELSLIHKPIDSCVDVFGFGSNNFEGVSSDIDDV